MVGQGSNPTLQHLSGNDGKSGGTDDARHLESRLREVAVLLTHNLVDPWDRMSQLRRDHANQPIIMWAGALTTFKHRIENNND